MARFVASLILRTLAVTVAILTVIPVAKAQITEVSNTTATPIPGVGHDYIKMFDETVNPANGSLSVHIDIPLPKARGITLPASLEYNSNNIGHIGELPGYVPGFISWLDDGPAALNQESGWSMPFPVLSRYRAEQVTTYPPYTRYVCDYSTSYVFWGSNGQRHNLNLAYVPNDSGCQNQSPGLGSAASGGDDIVRADGTPDNLTVSDADGTKYNFSLPTNGSNIGVDYVFPNFVEDRNGNQIEGTVDSLGRTAISGGFGTSYYRYPNATNTLTVSGLSSPYIVQWEPVASTGYTSSPTPVGPNNQYCNGVPGAAGPRTGVQSITLPNGKTYQFTYDSTHGLINKITYPTGAVVTYTWNLNPNSEFIVWTDSQAATQGCEYRYGVAAISQRTVSFDGVHTALEQDFTYNTSWDPVNFWQWTLKTTTVVTKDCARASSCATAPSFTTTYTYTGCACSGNDPTHYPVLGGPQIPLEKTITYNDWNAALLRTVTKGFHDPYELGTVTTQTENNLVSETDYIYAPMLIMQLTERDDYDWGSGARGPLLRKMTYAYADYSSWRIYDAMTQASTYNGGNALVAQTNYGYDQSAVTPTSAVVFHDYTNYSSTFQVGRRNPTQVTHCIITNGTCAAISPVTTYAYDDTGQVLSMTDPCG
jgi:hypothetical protein